MVCSAIIFAIAFVAIVNADVSQLSSPPANVLNPVPGLPSTPIVISAQTFADVPYGVNPFGKNANQRPLPQPSTPIVVPVFAAPRNAAVQPRSLVPPPTVLALPRPIQPVQQRVISASANQVVFSSPPLINQFKPLSIIETRPQQLRALPVIDRSLGNEINARILRQDQEINPDGSYQFAFETDNGITRSEIGTPKVLSAPGQEPVVAEQVSGSYSYFDNGVKYEVTYIADENGFRASGAHLPTPPPTPPHVLRLLEFLAKSQNN